MSSVAAADRSRSDEVLPKAQQGTKEHVRVMDGLRGMAILLVVLFHYWQLSWWVIRIPGLSPEANLEFIQATGGVGVDLFFFISAFCLTYPHAKAMFGLAPLQTLRHFYYRRYIKIVPSYVLAIVVLGVFFSSLYPSNFKHGVLADLGLHAVFLHNLFPETRSSFDSVLWSLGVEVQFYFIFPLLAWAFRRKPWVVAALMFAGGVCWRAWVRHSIDVDRFSHWDHQQLPGFLDLFGAGMLAAYLIVWLRQRPDALHRLRFVFTGLSIVAFVIFGYLLRWGYDIRYVDHGTEFWDSITKQWFALTFLCIAVLSVVSISLWRAVIANPVLTFLSTISYNLYLWHQAIGLLIRDRHWWKSSTEPPMGDLHWQWTYTVVAVGASVLVATAVTYLFERPLLRRGFRGVFRLVEHEVRSAGPATAPQLRAESDQA